VIRFRYKKAKSNLGDIIRPVAEIVLETNGLQIETPMYIDSGADITMIPLKYLFLKNAFNLSDWLNLHKMLNSISIDMRKCWKKEVMKFNLAGK